MWDCNGLECVAEIADIDKKKVWGLLKGQDIRKIAPSPNLLHWQLRAQFNPQRFYEIYIIEVQEDITSSDIRDAFDASPQTKVDTIRRIGHKVYSDRRDINANVIV